MIGAALLCIVFRVNLPVALVTTLYTNPVTIVPLYLLAYAIGSVVTGESGNSVNVPDFSWDPTRIGETFRTFIDWVVSLGDTLIIGLLSMCALFSFAGYFGARALWRFYVVREWRRRARRRAEAAAR